MRLFSILGFFLTLLLHSALAHGENNNYQANQNVLYQANQNALSELSIIDVASEGAIYDKSFAPGSRYRLKYVVGFAVLIDRPDECTFYVGQELEPLGSVTKDMAAVGILQAPSLQPKQVALKAMGAQDHFTDCDAQKGQPVEALLGLEMEKTNPSQKQIKQIFVLNKHATPEFYLLTLDLASEKVFIQRTR